MARRKRQPRMVKQNLSGHDFKNGGPIKNENTLLMTNGTGTMSYGGEYATYIGGNGNIGFGHSAGNVITTTNNSFVVGNNVTATNSDTMYVGGDMTVTGVVTSTPQEGTVNIDVTTGAMSVYYNNEWVVLDGTRYKPKKSYWSRFKSWLRGYVINQICNQPI